MKPNRTVWLAAALLAPLAACHTSADTPSAQRADNEADAAGKDLATGGQAIGDAADHAVNSVKAASEQALKDGKAAADKAAAKVDEKARKVGEALKD